MSKQGSEVKWASAIVFGRLMAERSFISLLQSLIQPGCWSMQRFVDLLLIPLGGSKPDKVLVSQPFLSSFDN